MPSLYSFPPIPAAPDGRGGAGTTAGSWDDPADQFAGGMAYVPRKPAPEPEHDDHQAHPEAVAADDGLHPRHPETPGAGRGSAQAPHDSPHPSGDRRRRRSRRGHGRKRLGPVVAIAGVVAVIGAIIGVGGGFGMVWLMRDSPLATVVSPEEEAERNTFIAACAQTLPTIDCGCLWSEARAAFTPEYRAATLRLIDERRELPVRLQRIRSEKLLGPDLAKTVWEATYTCTRR